VRKDVLVIVQGKSAETASPEAPSAERSKLLVYAATLLLAPPPSFAHSSLETILANGCSHEARFSGRAVD
jgi:hypothetical protein